MSMQDESVIVSGDTKRSVRVPPGQKQISDLPVLHYGPTPEIDIDKWTFTITGLVERERKLRYKEFAALPMVGVYSDIHCVTGWSRLDNTWEGVSTSAIKDLVKIRPDAQFVIVHCAAGFTTNLKTEDFFADDALFAMKHNGEPLEPDHGYPVRLVVPKLYFWKSAKWVLGVEFSETDRRGFWESHGYHNHGDPWKEERYERQE